MHIGDVVSMVNLNVIVTWPFVKTTGVMTSDGPGRLRKIEVSTTLLKIGVLPAL